MCGYGLFFLFVYFEFLTTLFRPHISFCFVFGLFLLISIIKHQRQTF